MTVRPMLVSGRAPFTLTISGESSIDGTIGDPGKARSGIRVNADGTLDKRENNTFTQIDAATDIVIPNVFASADFEVKLTDNNANLAGASAATGSWLAITTAPIWYVEQSGVGNISLNVTLEGRYKSGAVIDSGVFTGTATTT